MLSCLSAHHYSELHRTDVHPTIFLSRSPSDARQPDVVPRNYIGLTSIRLYFYLVSVGCAAARCSSECSCNLGCTRLRPTTLIENTWLTLTDKKISLNEKSRLEMIYIYIYIYLYIFIYLYIYIHIYHPDSIHYEPTPKNVGRTLHHIERGSTVMGYVKTSCHVTTDHRNAVRQTTNP